MKTKRLKSGISVNNCTFTAEAFVIDEHVAKAIQALAEACAANARAIQEAASRLAGPVNNSVALKICE